MNRKFLPFIIIILAICTAAFIWLRPGNSPQTAVNAFYPLQERHGPSASWPEWNKTKTSAERLIRIVRDNPDDQKSMLSLASLYINEGRASGNHDYYDGAALHYVDKILAKDSTNFEALTMKALVQLSKHRFSDALQTAAAARGQNPYNAFVHGLLVDSYVELGQYDKAVESADQMVAIRPDMRSYARVAYLREIHGDNAGAVDAMKMAVDAGGLGDEQSSWTRIQLGKLYEEAGNLPYAAMHYQKALDARPDYANAVAGMGRIAMIQKDYHKALQLFLRADTLPSDHGFSQEVAMAYLALNQKAKAITRLRQMERQLLAEVEQNKKISDAPFHTDMELANLYLLTEQYDKALAHALNEYKRRPANIEVADLVGWIYYKTGAADKALAYAKQALRTGYKNPYLLARAGLIFTRAGKREEAAKMLQAALANNTLADPELRQEATEALQAAG